MSKIFLIVDDDASHGAYVSTLLERNGFESDLVSSAGEALERLATKAYAAVITDILMPGSDGLELLRQIKRRYAAMPVLGVTGSSNEFLPVLMRAFIAFGGTDLLCKPLPESDLLSFVRSISPL